MRVFVSRGRKKWLALFRGILSGFIFILDRCLRNLGKADGRVRVDMEIILGKRLLK